MLDLIHGPLSQIRICMCRRVLLATLVVALAVIGTGCDAFDVHTSSSTTGTLKRVVFAHRHGARTPLINVNGSCDALGCGTLTIAGKRMLHSLGSAFRSRYNSVLPAQYNTAHYSTVSDESDRVIQSADAFLYGLFGSNAVYPVIDSTAKALIDPTESPGPSLHSDITTPEAFLTLMPIIERDIINTSTIQAIGRELGMWGIECSLLPPACLAETIDFISYAISEGQLGEFPLAQQFLPQLNEARLLLFRWIYGVFDESIVNTTYHRDAGWAGLALAEAMVSAANSKSVILSEFSGHDTTLMPLYASLGNLTFTYPEFGTAFVLEVYESGSSLNVVPFVATIGQVPALQTTVTFTPYQLNCLSSANGVYPSDPVNGCPLADFEAYIATRKGTMASAVSPSTCYGWPKDLTTLACDPIKNAGSVSAHSACGKYRAACPFVACGSGRYMTPSLGCNLAA